MRGKEYDRIEDWSREGRARLVEQRGDEIRAFLWLAFGFFYSSQDLSPFGFRGDDPVGEAVEWSIQRFRTGDLDPARCTPTFRLFTEARFWLAQKVGLPGYRRIMRVRPSPKGAHPAGTTSGDDSEDSLHKQQRDDVHEGLVRTLSFLRMCTCADMVGYWLLGMRRLRGAWFGWRDAGQVEHAPPTKQKRSFRAHDAMFRFQVLHRSLIRDDESAPTTAVRESMFRPCDNRPPYRRPDDEVARLLPAGAVTGPRAVGGLRRIGLGVLLDRLLRILAQDAADAREALERIVLRDSLSATTAWALDLERRAALLERLRALPPADSLVEEES